MSYVYFSEEQKQRANEVDLEDFLMRNGEELLKSGKEKRLKSDHSITVRGNRWYDHAESKGGCAIDFVQMFYSKSFPEAVSMLLNGEEGEAYRPSERHKEEIPKPFELPEKNENMRRVYAYLMKARCIDRRIITSFVKKDMIYEDKKYHNVVFVGYNPVGMPRHVHKRGTYTKGEAFKGTVDGSDPHYSFHYAGGDNIVYVFEAPIDMLSFISLYQEEWEKHNYVALCGVAEHALMQMLKDHSNIKRIALCLDNDSAGIRARERITKILSERGYSDVFSLFSCRKDWNEDLQAQNRILSYAGSGTDNMVAQNPVLQ